MKEELRDESLCEWQLFCELSMQVDMLMIRATVAPIQLQDLMKKMKYDKRNDRLPRK